MWHRKMITKLWPTRHAVAGLTRWPLAGWLIRRLVFDGDFMTFLPSEEAARRREKLVLPGVVVDHFIEKSSFRFLMDACICRDSNKCRRYPADIGCLFLGEAARQINPAMGRAVTVQEAKALQRRAEAAGLINMVGKNRLDKIWLGVEPAERLLTICHCCECCCLWNLLPVVADSIANLVHKLDGVEVAVAGDCRGCGACVEICFARAISSPNGRAEIDAKLCRGCGRCVLHCPRRAIELKFSESDYYHRCVALIEKVEEMVDVG
jgi:ferredoxin